jgi:hypothetical protein
MSLTGLSDLPTPDKEWYRRLSSVEYLFYPFIFRLAGSWAPQQDGGIDVYVLQLAVVEKCQSVLRCRSSIHLVVSSRLFRPLSSVRSFFFKSYNVRMSHF